MIGIDLNPGTIGFTVCDFKSNLKDKTTPQTKAILGDAGKELVNVASSHGISMIVEKLDFIQKKRSIREQGVKSSRMFSNFAYSSLIGLTKSMSTYGLSSDTTAALVLARRGLNLSEFPRASYARLLPVDGSRHLWSFWRKLSKGENPW